MRISLHWLREFVDIPDDLPTFNERLSMVGLAVDEVQQNGDDYVLELDITTNRGDCLSHLGVAREVAAIYGTEAHRPEPKPTEIEQSTATAFSISISDDDLCRRYCGRYIEGVRIEKSPQWLAQRIEAVGIRSVNNVADITNYVLMELGHPLHAFDADTLSKNQIIVRRADPGERMTTLDGQDRELDPSMLVIADAKRPVALAGIMGGEATEISSATQNVFLESAWFDLLPIRRTARAMNASTEASYRFERGADIEMAPCACDRAAQLIQEIAGGRVYSGVIDVYPRKVSRPRIRLRSKRIETYLGMAIPEEEVTGIFKALGFQVASDPDGWNLQVPSHRHDVSREEDLLEEVARIHGYDRFPSTLPPWSGQGKRLKWQPEEGRIRDLLRGMGYSEACSLAFSDPETERRFSPGVDPVTVRNPLSEEAPILRTSLVPSMLRSLEWNLNRGTPNILLYEIAKVYPREGECRHLILAQTGALRPATVHHPEMETDFYSLKGHVETLLESFAVKIETSQGELPDYYHPGRSTRIGSVVQFGELHRNAADLFRLRQKVYIAEFKIEEMYAAGLRNLAAATIPKYPAIRRDLSLLVEDQIPYSDVVSAIHAARVDELVTIEPFDRLESGPFPASFYSLGVGLVYQSSERTLTDLEVEGFEAQVLVQLEKIGVTLRS